MANGLASAVERLTGGSDPRLDEERWRAVPAVAQREAAIVVGVVHDHPASVHRVRAVVDAFDPDVVALELPRLVVPHFEREAAASTLAASTPASEALRVDASEQEHGGVAATDGGTMTDGGTTTDGGSSGAVVDEMTAAIAASSEATVVGVDSVDWRFLVRFARLARSRDASLRTTRRALGGAWRVTRNALDVRFGNDDDYANDRSVEHGVSLADDASVQAEHERAQIARSRTLLGALERPDADVLLDETREATMAARIDEHRRDGGVVAVVGMEHLDRIADALA